MKSEEVVRYMGPVHAGLPRTQGRHLINKTMGAFGELKYYFFKLIFNFFKNFLKFREFPGQSSG